MTRDSKQSQIESSGATRGHLVAQKHPQSKKDSQRDSQTALQAAWCSNTRQRAHPQTQIAGRHVHEQPFENIAMSAQMSSAHPSRVVQMSIGPLQQLAASPHQLFSALASNTTPIGIHRGALGVLIDPVLATAIRFTDVGA